MPKLIEDWLVKDEFLQMRQLPSQFSKPKRSGDKVSEVIKTLTVKQICKSTMSYGCFFRTGFGNIIAFNQQS